MITSGFYGLIVNVSASLALLNISSIYCRINVIRNVLAKNMNIIHEHQDCYKSIYKIISKV